jgi:hypothetical protein
LLIPEGAIQMLNISYREIIERFEFWQMQLDMLDKDFFNSKQIISSKLKEEYEIINNKYEKLKDFLDLKIDLEVIDQLQLPDGTSLIYPFSNEMISLASNFGVAIEADVLKMRRTLELRYGNSKGSLDNEYKKIILDLTNFYHVQIKKIESDFRNDIINGHITKNISKIIEQPYNIFIGYLDKKLSETLLKIYKEIYSSYTKDISFSFPLFIDNITPLLLEGDNIHQNLQIKNIILQYCLIESHTTKYSR